MDAYKFSQDSLIVSEFLEMQRIQCSGSISCLQRISRLPIHPPKRINTQLS